MKVLVTGATGALGSYLSKHLLERGDEVVSIRHDELPMDSAKALGIEKQITWCHGSILDGDFVKRVVADYEVELVYHLAALPIVRVGLRTTIPIFQVNLMGTLMVLEALKEQNQSGYDVPLVHMSTDKVYGTTDWGRKYLETDPLNADIPYEASKACADIAVRTYKASGFINRVSVVRPSNLYGPGDMNSRIIPNSIRYCLKDEAPKIFRDVLYIREYTFVQDWAEAMVKVAKHTFDTGGDVFNIGSGISSDQEFVIDEILRHFPHLDKEVVEAPAYTKKEIPYQTLDSTKIQETLGWVAETSLPEGISKTVEWWKQRF